MHVPCSPPTVLLARAGSCRPDSGSRRGARARQAEQPRSPGREANPSRRSAGRWSSNARAQLLPTLSRRRASTRSTIRPPRSTRSSSPRPRARSRMRSSPPPPTRARPRRSPRSSPGSLLPATGRSRSSSGTSSTSPRWPACPLLVPGAYPGLPGARSRAARGHGGELRGHADRPPAAPRPQRGSTVVPEPTSSSKRASTPSTSPSRP